jgi:uncharacterized membrane protein YhaH (DUF805 family)
MSTCLKQKLTSRKFWAAVISLLLSSKVIFFTNNVTQEEITALVTAASTLIAYIFSETVIDCKKLNSTNKATEQDSSKTSS